MAQRCCSHCGKNSKTGNTRSHSNIATKRRFHPNLQLKRVEGKKTLLCASCIRTIAKTPASNK